MISPDVIQFLNVTGYLLVGAGIGGLLVALALHIRYPGSEDTE